MTTSKATASDVLDRWAHLWMDHTPQAAPSPEFMRDVLIEQPLYDKAIMRGYIEHTGRQRFEVKINGKERKIAPRFFSKRRLAKKYLRKQMARTEFILLIGCYPKSIDSAGDDMPNTLEIGFEYTEAVTFNG